MPCQVVTRQLRGDNERNREVFMGDSAELRDSICEWNPEIMRVNNLIILQKVRMIE